MTSLPEILTGTLAVGWATVELDRAAAALAHLLVPRTVFSDAPGSAVLGAHCRVGHAVGRPALRIVLLEPAAEGRLAATLARSGEGWVATWVDGRSAASPLSSPRPGPLGDERLVLGGAATGLHRLVVDAVPSPP